MNNLVQVLPNDLVPNQIYAIHDADTGEYAIGNYRGYSFRTFQFIDTTTYDILEYRENPRYTFYSINPIEDGFNVEDSLNIEDSRIEDSLNIRTDSDISVRPDNLVLYRTYTIRETSTGKETTGVYIGKSFLNYTFRNVDDNNLLFYRIWNYTDPEYIFIPLPILGGSRRKRKSFKRKRRRTLKKRHNSRRIR